MCIFVRSMSALLMTSGIAFPMPLGQCLITCAAEAGRTLSRCMSGCTHTFRDLIVIHLGHTSRFMARHVLNFAVLSEFVIPLSRVQLVASGEAKRARQRRMGSGVAFACCSRVHGRRRRHSTLPPSFRSAAFCHGSAESVLHRAHVAKGWQDGRVVSF